MFENNQNEEINNYLLEEIETNKKEIWSKLNNSIRLNKVNEYTEELLKDEYSLNTEEINDTKKYLSELLEKKMINKNNDVVYDKDKEKLSKINHLNFNNKTRKFYIKKNKTSSISQTLRKKTKKINNTSLKNVNQKNN